MPVFFLRSFFFRRRKSPLFRTKKLSCTYIFTSTRLHEKTILPKNENKKRGKRAKIDQDEILKKKPR